MCTLGANSQLKMICGHGWRKKIKRNSLENKHVCFSEGPPITSQMFLILLRRAHTRATSEHAHVRMQHKENLFNVRIRLSFFSAEKQTSGFGMRWKCPFCAPAATVLPPTPSQGIWDPYWILASRICPKRCAIGCGKTFIEGGKPPP